jgi:tetratricopeptide (TPR) repeat protein
MACHMRPYGTSDIAHAASTDHRILRKPEKEKPPHSPSPFEDISLAHFHRGKVAAKDKELFRDLGIALSQVSIKKHNNRGIDQAVDILERSLQDFPNDLEIWNEKSSALFHQGRFSEALAACETILAKKPDRELALARAASAAQVLGEPKLASKYWKKAIAMNPWMVDYHSSLTKLLVLTGAWEEVGAPCRQWLRLSPSSPEARKIWIEYMINTGNVAQARSEFSRLEALRPADPESLKAWFADINKKKPKK